MFEPKPDESRLLTDEEIDTAEIKGAKTYKELVANLEIPYSKDGLVLFIQQSITEAQDAKTASILKPKVKLPENLLEGKIREGSSDYEIGWKCGCDYALQHIKEVLEQAGIEVEE